MDEASSFAAHMLEVGFKHHGETFMLDDDLFDEP